MTKPELLLSNCAYWAMNALGVSGSSKHVIQIQKVCLLNILNASKEFIIHESDADSTVRHEGLIATLIPVEGWPEPEREEWSEAERKWMNDKT